MRKPCLRCGRPVTEGSRCTRCQSAYEVRRGSPAERGYTREWRQIVAEVLATHRALYGDSCPGWQRPAHPASDLVGDHIISLANGGQSIRENCGALCVRCNGAKGRANGTDPSPPAISRPVTTTQQARRRRREPQQVWIR